MTRDGNFKKVVRRHAAETGQRYTEALTDLEGLGTRMHHEPVAERLLAHLRDCYGGHGLPEALLHGNLLHAPDHAVVSEQGPVAINWKASGRGPRLADFAYLMWGTWLNEDLIDAGVNAYRRHVELTDDELDRLEAVMYIRPCTSWASTTGVTSTGTAAARSSGSTPSTSAQLQLRPEPRSADRSGPRRWWES